MAFTAVMLAANLGWLYNEHVGAAQLQTRSLSLTSTLSGDITTGAANTETNGSDTTHTFTFNTATGATIQSVGFLYCDNAIGTCNLPTGLSAETGTSIVTQTDNGTPFGAAYSIDGTISTDNFLCATNGTGNVITAGNTVIFAFDDIRNPDYNASPTNPDDNTFFVRISLYSDATCTTVVDEGTVASAITQGISITSKVVETLGFSVANDAAIAAEGANCQAITGSGAITLGDPLEGVLSISQAYDAFSAFRLFTNSANGTLVRYRGATLTKGTDDIDAINPGPSASAVGTEQFGLAIDADGVLAITGSDGGFGGVGQLDLAADYDGGEGTITNGGTATFAFVPNTITTLAESTPPAGTGYVSCDTAAVRYIGNISALTPAGTYTTTIVYYAVPTY